MPFDPFFGRLWVLTQKSHVEKFCFHEKKILFFKGLVYGDWTSGPDGDGTYSFSMQFEPSAALQNNGSIYLHTFVVKGGKSPDPSTGKGKFSKKWTMYKKRMMNK